MKKGHGYRMLRRGKVNFSKALHAATQLELIHLDQHYWKPERRKLDNQYGKPKYGLIGGGEKQM